MIRHMMLAAAITLSMGAAAFADSGTDAGATGDHDPAKLPGNWSAAVGSAFFSDPTTMTLRSEGEIRTNWQSLSAEEQAQVKADCRKVAANSETTSSSSTGSTTSSTSASGLSSGATMPGANTGSLTQLCTYIKGM